MSKGTKKAKGEENGSLESRVEGLLDKPVVSAGKRELVITPPKMEEIVLKITGTRPLVQNRFGEKARNMMRDAQEAGSQGKKGKKRDPKDFNKCFEDARHVADRDEFGKAIPEKDRWDGIHAGGFRRAMVDACTLVGFHMTKAKKSIFIIPDGFSQDGTPLVKITKGTPKMHVGPVRNASGVADLRARPMWDIGWEATVRVKYDADLFGAQDVVNLLARVGTQCGVAEGRPNSKESTGCDWGLFDVSLGETVSLEAA